MAVLHSTQKGILIVALACQAYRKPCSYSRAIDSRFGSHASRSLPKRSVILEGSDLVRHDNRNERCSSVYFAELKGPALSRISRIAEEAHDGCLPPTKSTDNQQYSSCSGTEILRLSSQPPMRSHLDCL